MEDILPDVQRVLMAVKLIAKQKAPFYAYWASKFITFSNKYGNLANEATINQFLDHLCGTGIDDWKIQQAEEAIDFFVEYCRNSQNGLQSNRIPSKELKNEALTIIERIREAIRLKHYSYRTEQTYLEWAKRFFSHLLKTRNKENFPQDLNSEDVKEYLSYLAIKQKVSSSTQNQAFSALLFLFREVLKIEVKDLNKTVRAKRKVTLPAVLTLKEIKELFNQVNRENLLLMQTIYGSGLRLMEAIRLRVQDIDFDTNILFIRGAKGDKYRATVLAESVKTGLKKHLEKVKEIHRKDLDSGQGKVYLPEGLIRKYPNAAKEWGWQYVFPSSKLSVNPRSGKVGRHHIDPSSIQKVIKNAVKKAGIVKNASVHTLRHSFATHLLMKGVNIREIQDLLGHKHLETTMVYTHVIRDMSNVPISPLDYLYKDAKPSKKYYLKSG